MSDGGVAKTLNSIRSDADHIPVALIFDARGNGGGWNRTHRHG